MRIMIHGLCGQKLKSVDATAITFAHVFASQGQHLEMDGFARVFRSVVEARCFSIPYPFIMGFILQEAPPKPLRRYHAKSSQISPQTFERRGARHQTFPLFATPQTQSSESSIQTRVLPRKSPKEGFVAWNAPASSFPCIAPCSHNDNAFAFLPFFISTSNGRAAIGSD